MSDYAIIFQALGVILALFFIFLTVMNFKTWRWLHALTTFAVFCAVATFMVYAALVMKTRLEWEKSHSLYTAANEKVNKDLITLMEGEGDLASMENSLAHFRSELARSLVDRGRVWRGCTPAGNADGSITLTMNLAAAAPPPVVDPAAPPATPPAAPAAPAVAKKHELKVQDIVFAFKEFASPEGSLPVHFVGEFQVTAVTETTVSLAMNPTFSRGPIQPNEVDAPWMLYEVLPPDAHEPFADKTGKALPADQLKARGIPDAAIQNYVRDNGPGQPSDPKENVWYEVKFLKTHEITVDASTMVSPVDEKHYDAQGQAQIPGLLRTKDPKTPEKVKFEPNDIAIFDGTTADNLANANPPIVQKQRQIYRRKLNDYEQAFQVLSRELYTLRDKITVVARDTATVIAAKDKALEQTKLEEAAKALLQADHDKIVYERDETKKYADAVAARIKEKRAEMSRLYLSNKAVYAEIQRLNQELTDEVERRQREETLPALAEEKK